MGVFFSWVRQMNLRELRVQLGDTQSEFAQRYHIPFRTVQNWETGVRKPPEYIMELLENRIMTDLVNRRTRVLPAYDPQKLDLPNRREYIGAVSWLCSSAEKVVHFLCSLLNKSLIFCILYLQRRWS